jgi:hypothetical protein
MKDYFGNSLETGDEVIFAYPKSSGTLHRGKIVKVTTVSIIIDGIYKKRILYLGDSSYYLIKFENYG